MLNTRIDALENFSSLSEEGNANLNELFSNGGILKADKVKVICNELSVSIEKLMVLLLPVAETFAIAPISSFKVGAVVSAHPEDIKAYSNLYLGANFEYENLSLNFSIHAEQSAVSNAWLNGENGIAAIATSAAPCGHCRQFLYETSGTNQLPVIMPANATAIDTGSGTNTDKCSEQINSVDIQSLLPSAFGPKQLDCDLLLMEDASNNDSFNLIELSSDQLVLKAFEQAKLSYAPYTKNYAGCVIEMTDGNVFVGRNAENAAHNPSLSAFSSAVSQVALSLNEIEFSEKIKRVVLVENPTLTSQKEYAKLLLSNLTTNVELEYYQIQLN